MFLNRSMVYSISQKLNIPNFILIFILVAALTLRLAMVFFADHPELVTDSKNYNIMARQFLDKGFLGYDDTKPNAVITPGYPLFLATIYKVMGYDTNPLTAVRVIQSVLGTLTCLLFFFLTSIIINRKAGLLAAFIYAVYPTFVWSPSLILTETLYNFFFIGYLFLQLIMFETKSRFLAYFNGLIFAVAVMVRPVIFPLIVVPFSFQYFKTRDKRLLNKFGYTALGILTVMVPWWIRNVLVMDRFILLATQTGYPFIAGMFPYHQNIDTSHYHVKNQIQEGLKILINGLKTDPWLYIRWFTVGKLKSIFAYIWFEHQGVFRFLLILKPLHYAVIGCGFIGTLISLFKNKVGIISLYVILLTGLQLMFTAWPRYAYSIIPLLIILMLNLFHVVKDKYFGNKQLKQAG